MVGDKRKPVSVARVDRLEMEDAQTIIGNKGTLFSTDGCDLSL
jgi:hypothetical protein